MKKMNTTITKKELATEIDALKNAWHILNKYTRLAWHTPADNEPGTTFKNLLSIVCDLSDVIDTLEQKYDSIPWDE